MNAQEIEEVTRKGREDNINTATLNLILNTKLNRIYPKHSKVTGDKDKVTASMRFFNGQRQIMFIYGKTIYPFSIDVVPLEGRDKRLLRKITGRNGVEALLKKLPIITQVISKADLLDRQEQLRRGAL